jgi:VanZ family protein
MFTAEQTSKVLIPILHWLLPKAPYQTLLVMHHYIRKTAHFVEYFVFSLLILRAIRAGRPDTRFTWALVAVIMVAAYAALDEFHQSFVPGRTPLLTDVLLDTSGGVVAQILAALVLLWGHSRQRRENA